MFRRLIEKALGTDANLSENSAILKDEDRCIRCALVRKTLSG